MRVGGAGARNMTKGLRAESAPPGPHYARELARAGQSLDAFLEEEGLPSIKECHNDWDILSAVLQRYDAKMKSAGHRGAHSAAKHAILTVQHRYPLVRGHLAPAWSWIAEWTHSAPPSTPRLPMPEEVVLGLSCLARLWALRSAAPMACLWIRLAILLEVGFYGLFRPVELFELVLGKIGLPDGGMIRANSYAVLAIRGTKNWRQLGIAQMVIIRSAETTEWLKWLG